MAKNLKPNKRRTILPEDYDKLIASLKSGRRMRHLLPVRMLAIISLMDHTAMRIGEVLNLKPGDIKIVDTMRADIYINNHDGSTKTGNRIVPLILRNIDGSDTEAYKYLKLWKERSKAHGIKSEWLFHTSSGLKIRNQEIGRVVAREAEKAGIGYRVTPHMFRHTAATRLARNNFSPALVQKLLGHANIATTQVYFHVNEDDVAQMMSAELNARSEAKANLNIIPKPE